MNFLIFGAGAVGGLIGGRLALAGHEVTFLARPPVAKAIRARGLRIISGSSEQRAQRAQAATTASEALAGNYDCLIFSVKSFDTAEAIEEIRKSGRKPPPILCLQNGVDNEAALAEAFGAANVIAGTVTTTVTMDEPGTIIVHRERGLGVAAAGSLSLQLAEALSRAGFETQRYSDGAAMKWSKLLVNLIGNATSAICDVGTAEVFDHAGLYEMEIAALRECLAVMRAQGVAVVNLPRTPAGWLSTVLHSLPPKAVQWPLRYLLRDARGGKMPSFHADIVRGEGQSEVSWLNGAVARHGARVSVNTPVNRLLTETMEGILAGRVPWEEYRGRPQHLVDALKG